MRSGGVSRWWARFRYGWVRHGVIGRTRHRLRAEWFVRRHNAAIARRDPAAPAFCFSPGLPGPEYVITRIAAELGMRIARSDRGGGALDFAWKDVTLVPASAVSSLPDSALNVHCLDISKSTVDRLWREVSGRGLEVDPLVTSGPIVVKSETNARLDGRIFAGPLARRRPGVVYHRLVDNTVGDQVEDLRPVILDGAIVLVCRKIRPTADRFAFREQSATIVADAVFSDDEARDLATFARRIGLDYGEIDVLRDADGTIYVVDANKTPAGPTNGMSTADEREAIRRMATAFADLVARQAGSRGRSDDEDALDTPTSRGAATE